MTLVEAASTDPARASVAASVTANVPAITVFGLIISCFQLLNRLNVLQVNYMSVYRQSQE